MSASLPTTATDTVEPAAESMEAAETSTASGSAATGTGSEAVPSSPTDGSVPPDVVTVAADAKEGIASTGKTSAAIVDTLDSWALVIGTVRISVFDVLFFMATIALVAAVAWFLTRIARRLLKRVSSFDQAQKVLAEKLVTIVIWTVAFFVTVDLIGLDLTALAFFGGAFGLAIGFGLQKTFGNLISGILLLLDKSIKPGDVISVSDQAGNEAIGQIRKIGIRAISVITRDQTEHLIPNENLMINQVVNWSYSSKDVRVKAPVGVSYGSDLDLVTKLLYQAAEDVDRVLNTPKPRVNLMGFGNNSVDFELRFWIRDPEDGIANVRSDVYMRIWNLFKENDIEIPFPQRDLHLRSSKQLDQLVELMSGGKA